jgi:hypothetical protein
MAILETVQASLGHVPPHAKFTKDGKIAPIKIYQSKMFSFNVSGNKLYNVAPRYLNMYTGLHKAFWNGYINADEDYWKYNPVNDPIDQATSYRKSKAGGYHKKAFTNP